MVTETLYDPDELECQNNNTCEVYESSNVTIQSGPREFVEMMASTTLLLQYINISQNEDRTESVFVRLY